MTNVRFAAAALFAVAAASLFLGGEANAAVTVEKVQTIVVKDILPADQSAQPAPVAEKAPSPAQEAARRGRPGPRYGGVAGAVMAPAQMGASVADFVARAITNGVTGAKPAKAGEDPA